MEILWKRTVISEFRVICPKLYENCAFPQDFHTRKLGETMVFYAVTSVWIQSTKTYLKLQQI